MKQKIKITLVAIMFFPLGFTGTSQAYDVAPAGQPVVTGEPSRVGPPWNHRTTFNIPGTNTDIAWGGYVKLDAIYDFDYDLSNSTNPLRLRGSKFQTDGRTTFHAFESRINFRTQTHTELGDLETYVEGHFMPDGDFGLRHAYGKFNGFLAGKTFSNFMNFQGVPRTLKLGTPYGYPTQRPAQIRYTYGNGPNAFSVSLEDPSSLIAPESGVASETKLPHLTARYQHGRHFGVSGVVRHLATDEGASGIDESALGYGIAAQAMLPLSDTTRLKGNAMVGSGISRFLSLAPDDVLSTHAPDAYIDENGSLEAIDLTSFGASIEHKWNSSWSSALGTSVVKLGLPDDDPAFNSRGEDIQFSYVNLIWDVNDRLSTGLELHHVGFETGGGDDVSAKRLQASVQFQF